MIPPAVHVLEEAWLQLARRLGVQAESPLSLGGFAEPADHPGLMIKVEGLGVTMRRKYIKTPAAHRPAWEPEVTACELYAGGGAPKGFSLAVYPLSYGAIFAKAFGAQDQVLGDEAFDQKFVVKSSREELTRLWVDAEVRAWISQAERCAFHLTGGEVTATLPLDLSGDVPAQVESAFRVTAGLAGRGRALLARWRELARSLGGDVSSEEDSLCLD